MIVPAVSRLLRRLGGLFFATLWRLIPMRARYGACVAVSGVFGSVFAHTRFFRTQQQQLPLNDQREIALDFVLTALTRHHIPFSARLRLERDDILRDAVNSGRGVLLVSAHLLMGKQMIPYLGQIGAKPVILTFMRPSDVPGHNARLLPTSQTSLVRLRHELMAGQLVCSMVDLLRPSDRAVTRSTVRGEIHVSDALFRMAKAANAAVVFTAACLGADGSVNVTFSAPEKEADSSAAALAKSFTAFIETFLAKDRRDGTFLAITQRATLEEKT